MRLKEFICDSESRLTNTITTATIASASKWKGFSQGNVWTKALEPGLARLLELLLRSDSESAAFISSTTHCGRAFRGIERDIRNYGIRR